MKQNEESAWEALCKQCGRCCFEKIEEEDGSIFFTATPCRYLDVISRRCKIYPRRFSIYPECVKLTPELVRELPWLDDACAYRQALGLSHPPRRHRRRRHDR